MTYKVSFFVDPRGQSPVLQFLKKIDKPTQAKFFRLSQLLAQHGPNIGMPYSKRLTSQLSELRSTGKNPIRIIYTHLKDQYILLHAFQKKTNQTPAKETKTALTRLASL